MGEPSHNPDGDKDYLKTAQVAEKVQARRCCVLEQLPPVGGLSDLIWGTGTRPSLGRGWRG